MFILDSKEFAYRCLIVFSIVSSAVLLCASLPASALNKTEPLIHLPSNLPPSLYTSITKQAIFNVISGQVRFIPRINNSSSVELASRLIAFDKAWQNQPIPFMTLLVSERENEALICECEHFLKKNEYLVSEIPIKQMGGHYLSLNDESYKAIMELIHYPLDSTSLVTVAFSELAYVYNARAISNFLEHRGFELITSQGLMNSLVYPGFRDSQFMLIRRKDDKQIFVVIRGTSGALDIDTSLDGKLIPFGRQGKAHKGYAEVAHYIFQEITPFFPLEGPNWIITGHSLGGSVAILLSELLATEHRASIAINYAPAPLVDFEHYNYQKGLDGSISNFFLPNEELDISTENWLYLPGKKKQMDYAGTTAGAAHFVINYLKSRLIEAKHSKIEYEESLPNCVFVKYPCFTDRDYSFLPTCIFYSNQCLAENMQLFLQSVRPSEDINKLIHDSNFEDWKIYKPVNSDTYILEKKYKLIASKEGSFSQNIILAQLTLVNILSGNFAEARKSHEVLSTRISKGSKQGGIIGLNERLLSTNSF